MEKYKLSKIKGYITEEDGIYVLHNASGSKQSCTKNEIDFYGGVLVVQDLTADAELDFKVEPIIEEEPEAIIEEEPEAIIEEEPEAIIEEEPKKGIINKIFNK